MLASVEGLSCEVSAESECDILLQLQSLDERTHQEGGVDI